MIVGQQQIDTMEAMCLDAISCGMKKHKALEWVIDVGKFCMENEMYELMPSIHITYDKIKKL